MVRIRERRRRGKLGGAGGMLPQENFEILNVGDAISRVPTRSQSILSKFGKIHQELAVENVPDVVNHGVRHMFNWVR